MEKEWISLNEFKRRYHVGYETVLKLINTGKIESQKINKQYKIKVSKNENTAKDLENLIRRNEELETALKIAIKALQSVII